jgi:hypothetical protein
MGAGAVIGWLIFGAYLLGYACFWRRIVWALASELGPPDNEDVFFGVAAGSLLTLLWPFAVPIFAIQSVVLTRQHLLMPRHVRRQQRVEAREHELLVRERHILELERELGLKNETPERVETG